MGFERIGSEEIWSGHIGTVRVDRFRHDDGDEVQREVVAHPGAVVMLPWDGERIWLVRQPREVVGEELLELPAGKLNGGDPLDAAKRELREEIGKSARTWRFLTRFYASPGFTDERIHAYLATDLADDPLEAEEEERITVVSEPVSRLNELIASCRDAKSIITLFWFRDYVLAPPD